MPKEKRKNIIGNSQRHAPLGQVIADDENRSKYATVRSRPRGADSSKKADYDEGEGLLDEKTSRRIFELGREQLLEMEMEEQQYEMERRKNKYSNSRSNENDSSDEEDDMDSGSLIGEVIDDEE